MQNLVLLPMANELPIVNVLCIAYTWTNTCRTRFLLPVAKIHPIASTRVRDRTSAHKSELLFVITVLSELLFRAPELKHKSTLLNINEH